MRTVAGSAEPGYLDIIDCSSANLPTVDMIRCHGYPASTFTAETADGYRLSLHRIEHGKENAGDDFHRPAVLLLHDFLGSSADWVIQHHSKSLGFILADYGYDVWLGNWRGNSYSRSHVTLDPDTDREFWDFSIDELGKYDLPTMINKVLTETTEGDLLYVGHGLATTAFMAMSRYAPQLYEKIRLANFLSPMAFISNMRSPVLQWLAAREQTLETVYSWFGDGELLPNTPIMDCLASLFCTNPVSELLCQEIVFLFHGHDSQQLNATLMNSIAHHSPAGSSSLTLLHLLQLVQSGQFHTFDWGSAEENEAHHGSETPPAYSLGEVRCPVALYYSDNDWMADPADVARTVVGLPNTAAIHHVQFEAWNHVDWVWGMDAVSLVYTDLLENLMWCAHAVC